MRMKITKKRLKEILAEEIQNLQNEADYDKISRKADKAAHAIAKNRKGKKLHPANEAITGDDYHDDWEEVGSPDEDPAYASQFGSHLPESPIEKIENMIYDLADAIDKDGSDPSLADAYIALLRTMRDKGVILDRLMMMAEGKKK